MGIDSEAILVYGWLLEYDQMKSIVQTIFRESGLYDEDGLEDWEYRMIDHLPEWLEENHPDIKMGSASPYYNSCTTEHTFYITFREDLIKEYIIHPEAIEYDFLKKFGLDQPKDLCALVNIW